jgi:catechol 2,3-dioxygenase-like lactoylglutathione lyase family enzyme
VATRVWYRVRDLEDARGFYTSKLGFTETYYDADGRWAKLERTGMQIALAEGEPEEGGVATVDVEDVKGEADRLRGLAVEVGTVVELHNEMRLLDVFDPDGNRIQLVQDIAERPAE